jgi:outer membrane biosynthesis protein TonB
MIMVIGKITKEQVLKDLKEKLASGEITLEEITSLKPEIPEAEEPKEPEKVEEAVEPKVEEPAEEKTEEVEEVKEEQPEQIVPEIDYKAEIEELKKTNEALNTRMSALEDKILKGADFGARVVSNPSQESPQKHILAGHGSYD